MQTFLSGTRFIFLWILGTVFALVGAALVAALLALIATLGGALLWGRSGGDPGSLTVTIFAIVLIVLLGGSFGLFFGMIQKSLLRQLTGDPWRGWLIASSIGGIIGISLTFFLLHSQIELLIALPPLEIAQAIGLQLFAIPFACLGVAQWPILSQEVYNSWLWVLGNLVAGLVMYGLLVGGFFASIATFLIGLGLLLLLAAAPGIVTGFTMLSLLLFQRKPDY